MASSTIVTTTPPSVMADTPDPLSQIAEDLDRVTISSPPEPRLIDTVAAVSEVVDALGGLPAQPPSLYMDLEGINLCRHGALSILQLHVLPTGQTYLIDVHTLGEACFSTPGRDGRTLKDILESGTTPKVIFDVRNDSDALYGLFKISLAGVQDLQLMEAAYRATNRKFLRGLAKCIEHDAPLSAQEKLACIEIKAKGLRLFAPERGGSYEVFNQRPLSADMIRYCAQDVHILPLLWIHYNGKMTASWRSRMLKASRERVAESQKPTFNGKGRHMAQYPRGWSHR